MSKSINAYLMLGWEVEVWDAKHYDEYDGLDDGAVNTIKSILASIGIDAKSEFDCADWCINFWSLYHDCDYMRLGLVLASSDDKVGENDNLHEFASRLLGYEKAYINAAYRIYEAVMGKPAECPPVLMCVGEEG